MRILKGFTFLIGLVCLIVGVVGLVWVFDSQDVRGSAAAGNIDLTKSVSAAAVRKLDVKTDISSIEFVPAEGDEIKAHFAGTVPDDKKDSWTLTAETLPDGTWKVAATSKGRHFNIGLDFGQLLSLIRSGFSNQLALEISLPKRLYERIDVHTSTGRIKLGDVQADVLTASADTGSIELASFQGKDLRLKTDTGSIDFKQVQASGQINAQTATGRVHGALKELASPVTLKTNTGSVTLELPVSSQAKLELQTDIGSIGIDAPTVTYLQKEKHHVIAQMGAGTHPVRLETDTGSTKLVAE